MKWSNSMKGKLSITFQGKQCQCNTSICIPQNNYVFKNCWAKKSTKQMRELQHSSNSLKQTDMKQTPESYYYLLCNFST